MALTIVVTIGKYLLLVGLYVFVLVVFRGMLAQLAAESARDREAARARASRRTAAASEARPAARTVPSPAKPIATEPPALAAAARAVVAEPEQRPAQPPAEPGAQPASAAAAAPSGAQIAAELPAEPGVARVRVVESPDPDLAPGHEVPLSAAVTLGRADDNSLRVNDRFVSSHHALICLREGRRFLMDRGSTNGTYVNGKRIETEVELHPGDRIALGNTVLEYVV